MASKVALTRHASLSSQPPCASSRGGVRAQSQLVPFTNWMTYVGQQPGLSVTDGDAVPFTNPRQSATGCTPYIDTLGSCFGNNPITPYIITQPPIGSATLPDWALNTAFEGTGPKGAPLDNFYHLSMNEALVTVITLPPVGAYWSYQTYMIERTWQDYDNGEPTICPGSFTDASGIIHVTTPPYNSTDPHNCGYDIFGEFNNSVNNAVVFNQFGQGFNNASLSGPLQAIAVITTPNQALYNTLAQDFSAPQGQSPFGSASQIFPEAMPTTGQTSLNVGLQQTSDLFGTIIRYNVPENQTVGSYWLNNPGTYINVYRVDSSATPVAFPTPALTAQSYNTDECDLATVNGITSCTVTRYQNDLTELSGLLKNYLDTLGSDIYTAAGAGDHSTNGFGCPANGNFCQGSTNDNDSYRSFTLASLPVGTYAIVVGVLHSASAGDSPPPPVAINNSSYTSVTWADVAQQIAGISENEGVNGGPSQNDVSSTGFTLPVTLSSKLLTGSAEALLKALATYGNASPQLRTDLPDLYAVVLSRSLTSCNIPLCNANYHFVNVISDHAPPNGIPFADVMSITERAYLLPGTPDPLLPPSALIGANAPNLLGPTIIYDQTANP